MHLSHAALLSLDSLVAGLALAPLLRRTSGRLRAAALFGAADAAASALGALVPVGLGTAPALYGLYLATVAAVVVRRAGRRQPLAWPVVVALAAALSLDNLLAPAQGAAAIALAGATSAAMALAGLTLGALLVRSLPPRARTAWLGAGVAATSLLAVLA